MNVSSRRSIPVSAAIVLLTLAANFVNAQGNGNAINVALSSESTNLNGADDVTVNVTVTNAGSAPVFVPNWYVPSQAATAGVFTVTRDGEPVPYLGALVKRRAFSARDFVKLDAGASLDVKVELSALYDMSITGLYTIQYDVKSVPTLRGSASAAATTGQQAAQSQSAPQMRDLVSNTIALTITGDPNAVARRAAKSAAATTRANETPSYAASVSFIGCSNTRTSQISTALTSAESYASDSLSYLNADNRGSRYTTWFGTYNSSRYSTVRSHFSSISDATSTKALTFDCSTCPGSDYEDAYAYVYADEPYRVYLCNAFWDAPNTGTDSRAGTIIHELSHFTAVAGTSDYAYGQSSARSLARSNPSRAIRNADSHEYFSENTPSQD